MQHLQLLYRLLQKFMSVSTNSHSCILIRFVIKIIQNPLTCKLFSSQSGLNAIINNPNDAL